MIVTFTPFGRGQRIELERVRPTGSSFSCVGPAIGRLMLANRPPFSLFQVQTLGGTYSAGGACSGGVGHAAGSWRCWGGPAT